jgi:Nucleotidyl transferase of unknown function (DUF2204)
MELNQDFKEFIGLLNAHSVRYLVIGGYAVNFHGYPRYTRDLDFWIWLNENNIENLLIALNDFGFGGIGLTKSDFTQPDNVIQLGYEPYRIDILVSVEGLVFEHCFEHRVVANFEDTILNYLNIDDLITAKLNVGRPQDLADADKLQKIRRKMK